MSKTVESALDVFAERVIKASVSNRVLEQFLMCPEDVMGVQQLVGCGLLNFGHSLFPRIQNACK